MIAAASVVDDRAEWFAVEPCGDRFLLEFEAAALLFAARGDCPA